jgi:hypothetical protein
MYQVSGLSCPPLKGMRPEPLCYAREETKLSRHTDSRGGHRHWQVVGRMPNTDLKPDLRPKGVKDHTFLKKSKAKIVPSAIVVDHDFYTFNVKKHNAFYSYLPKDLR